MDSALRPREIQSRIRAGQSLEEVARLAGVPAERIEAYAAPVLAEREHVAGLALAATVRRRGESGANRTLRPVARERLRSHQVDLDTVSWDAWRNEDRRWSVQATWVDTDDQPHSAMFYFDLRSRFSIAADDEARWLIAEGTAAELTAEEESDELAIVRAVSPTIKPAGADSEPTVALTRTAPGPAEPAERDAGPPSEATAPPAGRSEPDAPSAQEPDHFLPRSAATPLEIGEAVEAEIDSYGLIPEGRSELDVLYDMLGGIAEDSINIYAGLADPVVPEQIGAQSISPAELTSQPGPPAIPQPHQPTAELPKPPRPPAVEPPKPQPAQPEAPRESAAASSPAAASKSPEPADGEAAGPEDEPTLVRDQPALAEDGEATAALKPGAAKRRRKGRAQVPSWEEIMFGSPKAD
jgi:hypothetical protein